MTTIRFIGDTHGKYDRYKSLIRDTPKSIQVGDMGVGFHRQDGSWDANPPFDAMARGDHRFIRGNPDNPEVCRRHKFWIPDGHVEGGIFFLGGATSIDKAYRIEGVSWWQDEECSYADLQRHIDTYAACKPDIVVTHEAPQSIADEILASFNKVKIDDPSRTRMALEQMLAIHQPRLWIFGHWHTSINIQRGRTRFRCLAELEHEDIDIEEWGAAA